jgi:hypothetical protein
VDYWLNDHDGIAIAIVWRIIAFTHAGVVREALWALLPEAPRVQGIGPAAISCARVAPDANRIVVLNEHRYIVALPWAAGQVLVGSEETAPHDGGNLHRCYVQM